MRVRIDLALATAYEQLEDMPALLPVARRIYEAYPDSGVAFMLYTNALVDNGKAEEARQLAQARLEKIPNDRDTLRQLARVATATGDFDAADAHMQRIIAQSQPGAGDYNNLAWNALFTGKSFDEAIEHANHSIAIFNSWGTIHTLAALYAEAGKSLEARTKLLEAMDDAGHEEPSSVDWYVLGRIAENYGAKDAALAAYKRVTAPKRERASSTYALTQRRLQALTPK
jgi:tetratricopeptide (TPR) repeat protein